MSILESVHCTSNIKYGLRTLPLIILLKSYVFIRSQAGGGHRQYPRVSSTDMDSV